MISIVIDDFNKMMTTIPEIVRRLTMLEKIIDVIRYFFPLFI